MTAIFLLLKIPILKVRYKTFWCSLQSPCVFPVVFFEEIIELTVVHNRSVHIHFVDHHIKKCFLFAVVWKNVKQIYFVAFPIICFQLKFNPCAKTFVTVRIFKISIFRFQLLIFRVTSQVGRFCSVFLAGIINNAFSVWHIELANPFPEFFFIALWRKIIILIQI